jgi:ABC-type Na+ efflux pump permease subunit
LSDITLHFYGLIALFVFLISIAGLFLAALVCLIIAFIKSGKANQKVSSHPAFAYFLSVLPLIIVNAAAFGILLYFVDSDSEETNQFLDKIAFYVWLPLQLVIWFVTGKIIQKLR